MGKIEWPEMVTKESYEALQKETQILRAKLARIHEDNLALKEMIVDATKAIHEARLEVEKAREDLANWKEPNAS